MIEDDDGDKSLIGGTGGYADNDVGAAAATGDGDVMMRMLPSLLAVEAMRQEQVSSNSLFLLFQAWSKTQGGSRGEVISRVAGKFPDFVGAVVTLNKEGEWGAACHGVSKFPFLVASEQLAVSTRMEVEAL